MGWSDLQGLIHLISEKEIHLVIFATYVSELTVFGDFFFHSTLDEILFLSIFFPGSGGVGRPWIHLPVVCLSHSSFITFIHFGWFHTKSSLSHWSKDFVQPFHSPPPPLNWFLMGKKRKETVAEKHESYKKKTVGCKMKPYIHWNVYESIHAIKAKSQC